jgi:hypothetical protein
MQPVLATASVLPITASSSFGPVCLRSPGVTFWNGRVVGAVRLALWWTIPPQLRRGEPSQQPGLPIQVLEGEGAKGGFAIASTELATARARRLAGSTRPSRNCRQCHGHWSWLSRRVIGGPRGVPALSERGRLRKGAPVGPARRAVAGADPGPQRARGLPRRPRRVNCNTRITRMAEPSTPQSSATDSVRPCEPR